MFACGRRRMPTVAAMLPLCILLALPSRASGQADPGTMVHPEPGSRIDSLLFHAFVFPDSLDPNQGLVSLAVYQCGDTTQRAARSAPRAKLSRLRAVWRSVMVSAAESKPISCVPGCTPARLQPKFTARV